ncbi:hypothetical protein FDP41_011778 [Naegleria fowleri]|uniref:Acyl-CoA oxidase C-terminal domain-containing protein n=1 Tax=Naegleria fowleri TaxID=5763 RepID=A0A6A5BXC5_NAEFO|nr:uncharacterized protein FDP41_011778 [Naegleria fowleri]KAF0981917.1 hypothetical protein FDP41_011778 [Naegleria fowleri]
MCRSTKSIGNAFNFNVRSQDIALKLCNAYVENHAIKVFMREALEVITSRRTQKPWTSFRTTCAVACLYLDSTYGFFLRHGLISGEQYGQLDEMMNSICESLTPLIPMLIKSFNFPEDILTNVPMGPKLVEMMAYDKIYE